MNHEPCDYCEGPVDISLTYGENICARCVAENHQCEMADCPDCE